ncbi:Zn-dependent exopeptidase [Trametes versicolor FP-101664 SS1]|uniref:Zn-dependent exopeptidase n=1 Tax=Trametes versicolor (strain FP-101664) TaxID=717944 RepID=UPI0004622987|nr:Zn-dependent exopeptidase [Trametes versicolor FP-101664 SS1]EIW56722.1 Zn-dependent exopeptidase [Trametes versicolor FP-101664 SS1]
MLLVNAVVPSALLIAIPHNPQAADTCLSKYYYGTHGQQDIFITNDELCVAEMPSDLVMDGSLGSISGDVQQLVWLQHEAVDPAIKPATFVDEIDAFLSHLPTAAPTASNNDQVVFGERKAAPQILHRTENAALISVDSATALTLDQHLPAFWKASPLPDSPIDFIPVPSKAIERVKDILNNLKFDPVVAALVNNISVPQLRADVRYLTGESSSSEIVSRHSFSSGVLIAAEWLKTNFENLGATCELKPYLSGFAPNVICSFKGSEDTTETVLISAHYDSRGSFGSTRAPGGDDDGSGTTTLLGIARTIARKGVQFKKNVQICAFSGEEQGLYGSRYYAQELRQKDANLTLMVQADMLAYHAPGEPAQLGLPDRIGTPEVTQLVATLSAIYSPELKVGFTPACCSDHQSFHGQGFPSTQVFERAGPIADPMYHNSGDLSDRENYDFEQIKSIAKVQFATLLHVAGFDLASDE